MQNLAILENNLQLSTGASGMALRPYINFNVDFIVQNTSTKTMQCHFDDGWDDPHQDGLQDCTLDRYNLCAKQSSSKSTKADWRWYDYLLCTYRNRPETLKIGDNEKAFNATVTYCADVAGLDFKELHTCVYGDEGASLLEASHQVERKLNTNKSPDGHGHPLWISVGDPGVQVTNSSKWLSEVCKGIGDSLTGDLAKACKQPDVTCPKGTTECLGIPGKKLCCTGSEYCIPGVGCTC